MSVEKHSRPTLARVRKRLRALGSPKDGKFLQRFFKSGPGQYGGGDKFLGIRVPATRGLAREFHDLPLDALWSYCTTNRMKRGCLPSFC